MAVVVEVKGGAAVETIGSTLYSRLNKSNHELGAKMHRLCTIGVSADRTVNSARSMNRSTD